MILDIVKFIIHENGLDTEAHVCIDINDTLKEVAKLGSRATTKLEVVMFNGD
jgi:hypothetical protein